MAASNRLNALTSETLKPVPDMDFYVNFDVSSTMESSALFAYTQKPDAFEEHVSKSKFEKFCDLYNIPVDYKDFDDPEITDIMFRPDHGRLTAKIRSFNDHYKFNYIESPYVRKGGDVLDVIRHGLGRKYRCDCERGRYSNTTTNWDMDKHQIYFGHFAANSLDAHDFGIFGPSKDASKLVGNMINYISTKYSKKPPKHVLNKRFDKKKLQLKEILMRDFVMGSA